jgi:bifunctional non-homologous end joining protein LigD
LRARETPTASTPISWEEVAGCRRAEDLRFTAPEVLDRVTHLGDLFAPVLDGSGKLPA